jgi:hypothetical protein
MAFTSLEALCIGTHISSAWIIALSTRGQVGSGDAIPIDASHVT